MLGSLGGRRPDVCTGRGTGLGSTICYGKYNVKTNRQVRLNRTIYKSVPFLQYCGSRMNFVYCSGACITKVSSSMGHAPQTLSRADMFSYLSVRRQKCPETFHPSYLSTEVAVLSGQAQGSTHLNGDPGLLQSRLP